MAKPIPAKAKPEHKRPPTTQVPLVYPVTFFARKVRFKESYVFAIQPDGQKLRIPYKDVIHIERMEKQVRVTYRHHGKWTVSVGKSAPVRINKYIVRYDRKGQEPVYVNQKEES